MNIIQGFPPNFSLIERYFGNVSEHNPVFSYGGCIYNPYKVDITPDIVFHENIHCNQQGNDSESWWIKYLTDSPFRLEQEIEAYGAQYAFIISTSIPTKFKDWVKDKIAAALSGPLYGNLISYGEAESKIRNYAKEHPYQHLQ